MNINNRGNPWIRRGLFSTPEQNKNIHSPKQIYQQAIENTHGIVLIMIIGHNRRSRHLNWSETQLVLYTSIDLGDE